MTNNFWNDWHFSWGWLLWFGFIFLMFSSLGNWRYAYGAHRKYDTLPGSKALDILNERYARGDINRDEYGKLKLEIAGP